MALFAADNFFIDYLYTQDAIGRRRFTTVPKTLRRKTSNLELRRLIFIIWLLSTQHGSDVSRNVIVDAVIFAIATFVRIVR